MFAGFLITFREVLEIALIVGIILSFLSRTGQTRHRRTVFLGLGAGLVVSLIGAVGFEVLAGGFEGRAEEIFEGVTMLFGAALLTTMIFWVMKQGRVGETLRARVSDQVQKPHSIGLFLLVFVSVLREGIETVIFLGAAGFSGGATTLLGGLLGAAGAVALGYAMFVASLRINLKIFFRVTNVLLILFAAGLVAHGVHELQEAHLLPTAVEHVWNINPAPRSDGSVPLLHEDGAVGAVLKTLFGYNGNPSLMEVIAYLAYLVFAAGVWWRIASGSKRTPATSPAPNATGVNTVGETTQRAFTLIELLIVVAIIAILAAIAVPNFLEAQARAKVSRVKSDFASLATAIETYRVDHNEYPEGTDNPAKYPQAIADFLGPLAPGYYTFRTRGENGRLVGRDFFGLTTPIAYFSSIPADPFAKQAAGFLTYSYRNAKDRKNGWILTSVGPDTDLLSSEGGKPGAGTANPNPLGTFADPANPARLGDISERSVIHIVEGTDPALYTAVQTWGGLRTALTDLSYDPTNGTVSDGDLYRIP